MLRKRDQIKSAAVLRPLTIVHSSFQVSYSFQPIQLSLWRCVQREPVQQLSSYRLALVETVLGHNVNIKVLFWFRRMKVKNDQLTDQSKKLKLTERNLNCSSGC